jgi:hypothetical protein
MTTEAVFEVIVIAGCHAPGPTRPLATLSQVGSETPENTHANHHQNGLFKRVAAMPQLSVIGSSRDVKSGTAKLTLTPANVDITFDTWRAGVNWKVE